MSNVRTKRDAIERFRNDLIRFNRVLQEETRRIRASYRTVGSEWNDEKYRQFGQELDDAARNIDRYIQSNQAHERHLADLIKRLDVYLDT